jgi:hypothetical protein
MFHHFVWVASSAAVARQMICWNSPLFHHFVWEVSRHKVVHPDRGSTLTCLRHKGMANVDFFNVVFVNFFTELRLRGTIPPRSWSRADAPSDTRVWLRGSLSASPSPPTTRNYTTQIAEVRRRAFRHKGVATWVFFQHRLRQRLRGTISPRSWRQAGAKGEPRYKFTSLKSTPGYKLTSLYNTPRYKFTSLKSTPRYKFTSGVAAWVFLQRCLRHRLGGTIPPRSWRRADAPSDTRVWLRGSSFSVAFANDYEELYHPDRGGTLSGSFSHCSHSRT